MGNFSFPEKSEKMKIKKEFQEIIQRTQASIQQISEALKDLQEEEIKVNGSVYRYQKQVFYHQKNQNHSEFQSSVAKLAFHQIRKQEFLRNKGILEKRRDDLEKMKREIYLINTMENSKMNPLELVQMTNDLDQLIAENSINRRQLENIEFGWKILAQNSHSSSQQLINVIFSLYFQKKMEEILLKLK